MSLPPHRRAPWRVAFAALLVLTFLTGAAPVAGASPHPSGAVSVAAHWTWPLGPSHVIVRPFLAPATPYSSGHRGIDVHGAEGQAVIAPEDGVVHFAGFVVDRPVLSIRHADGLISSYEPVTSTLVAGMAVHRGDTIGALQSGHCGAPCLHFGVRLHGQYVSPLNYLGGIPRSVLLPTRPLP